MIKQINEERQSVDRQGKVVTSLIQEKVQDLATKLAKAPHEKDLPLKPALDKNLCPPKEYASLDPKQSTLRNKEKQDYIDSQRYTITPRDYNAIPLIAEALNQECDQAYELYMVAYALLLEAKKYTSPNINLHRQIVETIDEFKNYKDVFLHNINLYKIKASLWTECFGKEIISLHDISLKLRQTLDSSSQSKLAAAEILHQAFLYRASLLKAAFPIKEDATNSSRKQGAGLASTSMEKKIADLYSLHSEIEALKMRVSQVQNRDEIDKLFREQAILQANMLKTLNENVKPALYELKEFYKTAILFYNQVLKEANSSMRERNLNFSLEKAPPSKKEVEDFLSSLLKQADGIRPYIENLEFIVSHPNYSSATDNHHHILPTKEEILKDTGLPKKVLEQFLGRSSHLKLPYIDLFTVKPEDIDLKMLLPTGKKPKVPKRKDIPVFVHQELHSPKRPSVIFPFQREVWVVPSPYSEAYPQELAKNAREALSSPTAFTIKQLQDAFQRFYKNYKSLDPESML
ncbi:MAG: hypothetical protein SFT81_05990 [Candidatus Caenarcaniphilales bacterium]|nr:hypothetical protein [Candidatus Caenarcaniphilales bacterium]